MDRTFEVKTYEVMLTRAMTQMNGTVSASIFCRGDNAGEVLLIFFPVAGSVVPNNVTSDPWGSSWLEPEQYARHLDLLRNEKPVFATISDVPNFNSLHTGKEPVGVGELFEEGHF